MDIKVNGQVTIVLDLDDTLYNEIDFLKSAYKEIAKEINKSSWIRTYAYMLALYRAGEDVFSELSKNEGISKGTLIDKYRQHEPQIYTFNHVHSFLQKIKNHSGRIAILTDGRSLTQRNKIKALNISDYIDEIFISEEIGSEKPSEENFKKVENFFKTERYYYIADNLKKDFIAPNRRGWNTICLIDNGLNIHYYPNFFTKNEYLPTEFVVSFEELIII